MVEECCVVACTRGEGKGEVLPDSTVRNVTIWRFWSNRSRIYQGLVLCGFWLEQLERYCGQQIVPFKCHSFVLQLHKLACNHTQSENKIPRFVVISFKQHGGFAAGSILLIKTHKRCWFLYHRTVFMVSIDLSIWFTKPTGTGSADGWAKHKPMDCEELMVKQVEMTVSARCGHFLVVCEPSYLLSVNLSKYCHLSALFLVSEALQFWWANFVRICKRYDTVAVFQAYQLLIWLGHFVRYTFW